MVNRAFLVVGVVTVALGYYLYHPLPEEIDSPWKLRIVLAGNKLIQTTAYFGAKLGINSEIGLYRALTETVLSSRHRDPRVQANDADFNGVKVRIYRPKSEQNSVLPALVYYHGGGWVYFTVDAYDGLTSFIAAEANIAVVSVDYRRAPEHVYPAALDDCDKATRYLLRNAAKFRVDPNRIGIAGDSAGGNLAAAVALRLRRDKSAKSVRFQGLIYPALQLFDVRLPAHSTNNFTTPSILTTVSMAQMWLGYLQGHANDASVVLANQHTSDTLKKSKHAKYVSQSLLPSKYQVSSKASPQATFNKDVATRLEKVLLDPFANPLMAEELAGLPAAYVLTAEFDVLRDDGLLYVRRLKEAGVQVQHKHYGTGFHGFYTLVNTPLEADISRRGTLDFVKYMKAQGF